MKYQKSSVNLLYGLLTLFVGFLFLAGCTLGSEPDGRITLHNEELILVDLEDTESYSRALPQMSANRTAKAVKPAAPNNATITYVADVAPPTDSLERELQASHIALTSNGKYAIVSYMLRGVGSSGAIDIIDVSKPTRPGLLRTTLFEDFDIAAVIEDSGKLYLAGQKIDNSGLGNSAYVVAISYNTTGVLEEANAASISLPGHFATDLVRYNGLLYVTTGAYSTTQPEVGLFVLGLNNSAFTIEDSSVADYPDLRSVAVGGNDLAVFEAQAESPFPTSIAKLDIYEGGELDSRRARVDLTAFPAQAEAKSKVGYFGGLFFVATNLSGVAIIDPNTGSVRASIPAPSLANLAPELQTSNAVSSGNASGKDIILIANGEAGLWVGDGDLVKIQTGGATSSTTSINGSIRFGAGESVNYVAGKAGLVVAAVGTGGLKVLNLAIK